MLLYRIRPLCVVIIPVCIELTISVALRGHNAIQTVAIVPQVSVKEPISSDTLVGAWISILLFRSPIGI